MRRRWLAVLLVVVMLGGVQQAAAQTPPALSALAQPLTRYALTAADLPADARLAGPPVERSNEDVVVGDPDQAEAIRKFGRIAGIRQTVQRPGAPAAGATIALFRDAEGALGDTEDVSGLEGLMFTAEPGPATLGAKSLVIRIVIPGSSPAAELVFLGFQRDRVSVGVDASGPRGRVTVEDLLPLAEAIDKKVQASPPAPATAEELVAFAEPSPTVLVRGAARVMVLRFVDVLPMRQVLTEGWEGAAAALRRAGVASVPPVPAYPSDDDAALALHMQSFPMLESLAQGRLTPRQLAYAAINGMVEGRDDCHTYHLNPDQWQRQRAAGSGGLQPPAFGIAFALDTPVRLVAVVPGSPAQAAGLRRGQIILSINGTSVTSLNVSEARALLLTAEGTPNTFVVQNPSGKVETIVVAPARYRQPPLVTEVVGNIGIMRMYGFQNNDEQIRLMRAALFDFESKGVEGWIIDLRGNPGGGSETRRQLTSMFIEGGNVDGVISRGQPPVYTRAAGNTLPFQRPLAFLVNNGSASAAEIMPGALQLRGRAIVVGTQTAGCIGSTNANGLLDGSALYVTRTEYVLGPNDTRLHRIGITPNVSAPDPSALDEEEGRDGQQEAAVAALRRLISDPATSFPIPAPPPRTAVIVTF